jgi:uncharacterized membrane protein YhaH (DUF805 family)
MDFMTAVRTCLSKYVDFSGRARRSEFWYFVLFSFLVGIVATVLDLVLGTDDFNNGNGLVNTLAGLALLLPSIAVAARRLHDIGRSGWWQLIGLASLPVIYVVPLLGLLVLLGTVILLVVWFCTDSKDDNQYGPHPKREAGTGGYPPPPAEPYGSGQYGG